MSLVAMILSLILLGGIGIALLQTVNALFFQERRFYRWHYHRDMILVDTVVLLMYLMIAGMVAYIYTAFHYEPLVLLCFMVLLLAVSVAMLARHICRHLDTMVYSWVAAFAAWSAVVLYLTLFSRMDGPRSYAAVMTPFRGVAAAMEERSLVPLGHVFLNILLFVPFGFLLPCCNPKALSRAGFAILGGLVVSTVIEGLQMLLGLGYCDIDDIMANALGAAIGYGGYRLYGQVKKNWRLF